MKLNKIKAFLLTRPKGMSVLFSNPQRQGPWPAAGSFVLPGGHDPGKGRGGGSDGGEIVNEADSLFTPTGFPFRPAGRPSHTIFGFLATI